MRVALFATCFNDTMFPEAPKATVRLLERTGRFLLGRTADAAARREACFRAAEEVAPRSTPEYKRWVVEQLLGDFLEHLPGGPRCDEGGVEDR